MGECDSCGAHVSDSYERVFEDNHGRLRQCPHCGFQNARWSDVVQDDI